MQNFFLVAASYFFYGWWDWRFLMLIIFSTGIDYLVAIRIHGAQNKNIGKGMLWISLIVNLGALGFFKYHNFFLENFIHAFNFFGYSFETSSLNIVLPVGISFYTFQTLSYTIDVFNNKLKPTNNIVEFAAYVSFFPQLVAGPIERATHLLPQFKQKRSFNYRTAVDGVRQILYGLFKKVVIADNCAVYADLIFNNSDDYSGSTLLLGAIFFGFQIYGDFSGYSDIAIGTARLFGFDLRQNFAFPYFSRNISEFWRRWHISLSSWFRDYLYIPLGGSRGSVAKQVRNIFIIFVVSGFWHGANWTFIMWGVLNAILFLPIFVTRNDKDYTRIVAEDGSTPTLKEGFKIISTFISVSLTWVFFRSDSVSQAFKIFYEIFSASFLSIPEVRPSNILLMLCIFMVIEWTGRRDEFAIKNFFSTSHKLLRWSFYYVLVILIVYNFGSEQQFIYFQF